MSKELFGEINNIRSLKLLESWFTEKIAEIVEVVAMSHCDRVRSLINRAVQFIRDNYHRQLTVKDVADSVFISSAPQPVRSQKPIP